MKRTIYSGKSERKKFLVVRMFDQDSVGWTQCALVSICIWSKQRPKKNVHFPATSGFSSIHTACIHFELKANDGVFRRIDNVSFWLRLNIKIILYHGPTNNNKEPVFPFGCHLFISFGQRMSFFFFSGSQYKSNGRSLDTHVRCFIYFKFESKAGNEIKKKRTNKERKRTNRPNLN